MADPVLFGPSYSTYTRTARLAFEEKGVNYDLVEINFIQGGMPAEQVARHPFAKVPALEHDGFGLYETAAITRYVDEAFPGPKLQPEDVQARARMTQIVSLLANYAYAPIVGQVVVQRLVTPMMGGIPDAAVIEAALPEVQKAMDALEALLGDNACMVGDEISLADLHLIPIYGYFVLTPESGPVLESTPGLRRWWESMRGRESLAKTQPPIG